MQTKAQIPPRVAASVAALLCSLGALPAGAAAKPTPKPPPAAPEYREVWVPADQLSTVLQSHPEAVLLTRDQYDRLVRDARAEFERTREKQLTPPALAVIKDSVLRGTPAGDMMKVEAEWTVECLSDEWSRLPLSVDLHTLASLQSDGASVVRVTSPAPAGKKSSPETVELLLRGKGEKKLRALLFLPIAQAGGSSVVQFRNPGGGASRFDLTPPAGAEIESPLPFTTGTVDGAQVVRLSIPPGAATHAFSWKSSTVASLSEAAVFQSCRYLYYVDASRVRADLAIVLDSNLTDLPGEVVIPIPAKSTILSVEGAEVGNWERAGESGIVVTLVEGAHRTAGFRVVLDLPSLPKVAGNEAAAGDVRLTLPAPKIKGMHRASGSFVLFGSEEIRIKEIATGALAVQDDAAADPAMRGDARFLAAFRFPALRQAPEIALHPAAFRFSADLDTLIHLKRDGVTARRNVALRIEGGEAFATVLTLPAGERVERVALAGGEELNHTFADGRLTILWPDSLRLGAERKLVVDTRVSVPNWSALASEPRKLTFTGADVEDAARVSGYLAVTWDDAFQVNTLGGTGLERRDSRVTPVQGKVAWFRLRAFSLDLEARRRAAEIEATVTGYALPMASALDIRGEIGLNVAYSALRAVDVKVPPEVAEDIRFEAANLAEKVRDPDDPSVYRLRFTEEIKGAHRIPFSLLIPFKAREDAEETRFSTPIPVITVPGAKRLTGSWMIEANTDTEVNLQAEGLDALDLLRAPALTHYTPRHRVIAAYRYRGDAWNLRVEGVRHPHAGLVTAAVEDLRIDSVLGLGGREVHEANLDVRSGGDQFLDLTLPDGARVWTLTVDGQAAKPVHAGENIVRVQFPSSARRNSLIPIRLIYQLQTKKWGGAGRRELSPVKLVEGVPVLRSSWNLHVPDEFSYREFDGNLQPDFEETTPGLLRQLALTGSSAISSMKVYRKAAVVEVAQIGVADDDVRQVGATNAGSQPVSQEWLEKQKNLVRNRYNVEQVVDELDLQKRWGTKDKEQAIAFLRDRIRVRGGRNAGNRLSIEVASPNEQEASEIANALASNYTGQYAQVEQQRAREEIANLEKKIAEQKAILGGSVQGKGSMVQSEVVHKLNELKAERERHAQQFSGQVQYGARILTETEALQELVQSDQVAQNFDMGVQMPSQPIPVAKSPTPPAGAQAAPPAEVPAPPKPEPVPQSGPQAAGEAGAGYAARLLPIEIELPATGRTYRFEGLYAPDGLGFGYVKWERQTRVGWWWILAGGLAFVFLARKRPVWIALWGILLLHFIPLMAWGSATPFFNALLLGWLVAFGLRIVFGIWRRIDKVGETVGKAATAGLAAALLAGSMASGAAATPPATSEVPAVDTISRHEVIVPYNPKLPVLGQDPARYYLDKASFERLWKAAKASRKPKAAGADDEKTIGLTGRYVIGNALYRARVGDRRAEVEAVVSLRTFGKEWVKVPIDFGKVSLGQVRLDGRAAPLKDGHVFIGKAGAHTLEAKFEIPLAEGWRGIEWKSPRASAIMLTVTPADERIDLAASGALAAVEEKADGKKTITAAFGRKTTLQVTRKHARLTSRLARPGLLTIDSKLFVAQALERVEAEFRYAFDGASIDRFVLSFDASLTPVTFQIPHLKTWKLRDGEDGMRVLEFELTRPADNAFEAKLVAERNLPELTPGARACPPVGGEAERIQQLVAFYAGSEVKINPEPGPAHRQVTVPVAGDGFRKVAAFRFEGAQKPPAYRLQREESKSSATVNYVLQAGRSKLEQIATLRLRTPGKDLFETSFGLPPGMSIQLVQGPRVRDWWRDGDNLRVRFTGATPDETTLLVYLAREFKQGDGGIAFQPLVLHDFPEVAGAGLIAAHKSVETTLRLTGNEREVREIDPVRTMSDTRILPPLERKRAFRYKGKDFTGEVTLREVPVSYDAIWVMSAQSREGWVALSTHVDIEVKKSALTTAVFEMPELLPEARVFGDEVRETRVTLGEDGIRRYEVSFQADIVDTVSFTVETDFAHTGKAVLPHPGFPGARRVEGFLIVENESVDQMKTETRGLDEASREGMPFLPETMMSARFFRVLDPDNWALSLEMEKLETTAGRSCVALHAELTTALRENGEEWGKAVYRLQNRSLQFLPVRLPEGSRLMAVRVAGQPVRADRGKIDGKPVLLIPLIQTRPGELAYDVEIVYQAQRSDALQRRFKRTLNDPELPGVTIERTLWNLWLPAGYRLDTGKHGNMSLVLEQASKAEKLRGDLAELNKLLPVLNSSSYSEERRQLACDNFISLADKLESSIRESERETSDARRIDLNGVQWDDAQRQLTEIRMDNGALLQELNKNRDIFKNQVKNRPPTKPQAQPQAKAVPQAGQKFGRSWNPNWKGVQKRYDTKAKQIEVQNSIQIENLGINDQVWIANKELQDVEQKETNAKGGAAKQRAKRQAIDRLEQRGQTIEVQQKAIEVNKWQGEDYQMEQDSIQNNAPLNNMPNAPANAGQRGGQQGQQIQVQAPVQQLDVNFNTWSNSRANLQHQIRNQSGQVTVPVQTIVLDKKPVPADPFMANPADAGQTASIDLGRRFRTTGRTSLDFGFPTEGQVYFFKKVKGHAELEIAARSIDKSNRAKHATTFLILAAFLAGGGFVGRKFRRG